MHGYIGDKCIPIILKASFCGLGAGAPPSAEVAEAFGAKPALRPSLKPLVNAFSPVLAGDADGLSDMLA